MGQEDTADERESLEVGFNLFQVGGVAAQDVLERLVQLIIVGELELEGQEEPDVVIVIVLQFAE